jgi:hypothetical protein
LGKVKKITSEKIAKGDSVYMIPVSFTYDNYLHSSYRRWRPDKDDLANEHIWDSVQHSVLKEYFSVERIDIGPKDSLFKFRPFKFKILLGGPETTLSNLNDYNIAKFTWNIRAGKMEQGFEFLPETIKKLSQERPVAIFTSNFFFYGVSFQAGYAQGSTGLQVIPDCLLVILSKGEVLYYRNYRKRYGYEKFERRRESKEKFTRKLFDKL